MKKNVEILDRREVFRKHVFRVEEVHLRHQRYDGRMSDEIIRLNLDRGDSAAALVHETTNDLVILTEQFRYPTYDKGPGWMLELPAGIVEHGEDPRETVKREILEEIGYTAEIREHIATVFVSPGGSSERIHIYYAPVAPADKTSAGGGVIAEGEDIRLVSLATQRALDKLGRGEIIDAKTVIALQWLQLFRPAP